MQHLFSMHTSAYSNNYRQTYVLLLLGFVFLTLAWLGMFNSFSIGVLLLGLGMLVVGLLNPRRFLSAGWLMASLGVATFLMFRHSIPDSQVLTAHLLAIGLGLLGIAWMGRRGYIRAGALTPGFFVVGVGVTEYLQAVHLIPSTVIPLALSLWLPGFGLFALGLFSLAACGRTHLAERMKTSVHHGSIAVHAAKEDAR
jgi:hypothetical protein